MHGMLFVAVAGLLAFVPAQSKKGMAIQRALDHCAGLSSAQCCAQTLRLKGFKAAGERLSDKAGKMVELSCRAPDKKIPMTACRAIAIARGLGHPEAKALCASGSAKARCRKDELCDACTDSMRKIAYDGSAGACLAVTHTAKRAAEQVVVVGDDADVPANAVVIKKRTVVTR